MHFFSLVLLCCAWEVVALPTGAVLEPIRKLDLESKNEEAAVSDRGEKDGGVIINAPHGERSLSVEAAEGVIITRDPANGNSAASTGPKDGGVIINIDGRTDIFDGGNGNGASIPRRSLDSSDGRNGGADIDYFGNGAYGVFSKRDSKAGKNAFTWPVGPSMRLKRTTKPKGEPFGGDRAPLPRRSLDPTNVYYVDSNALITSLGVPKTSRDDNGAKRSDPIEDEYVPGNILGNIPGNSPSKKRLITSVTFPKLDGGTKESKKRDILVAKDSASEGLSAESSGWGPDYPTGYGKEARSTVVDEAQEGSRGGWGDGTPNAPRNPSSGLAKGHRDHEPIQRSDSTEALAATSGPDTFDCSGLTKRKLPGRRKPPIIHLMARDEVSKTDPSDWSRADLGPDNIQSKHVPKRGINPQSDQPGGIDGRINNDSEHPKDRRDAPVTRQSWCSDWPTGGSSVSSPCTRNDHDHGPGNIQAKPT